MTLSTSGYIKENEQSSVCDICDFPILGIRYKCMNCNDYDLCEFCEDNYMQLQLHNIHHIFLKVRKPLPQNRPTMLFPNIYTGNNDWEVELKESGNKSLMQNLKEKLLGSKEIQKENTTIVHKSIFCSHCNLAIIGSRFNCATCEIEYNLCETCEVNSTKIHSKNHLFLKIRFSLDNPFTPLYKITNVYPEIVNEDLKKSMHIENIPVVEESSFPKYGENSLTLRDMRMNDVDEIMSIENESFSTPYSSDFFVKYVKNKSQYCGTIIAQRMEDINPVIAGYVSYKIDHKQDMVIVSLAVASHSRRRGVGSVLMDWSINHAKEYDAYRIKLHVSVFNLPAQKLYSSKGFKHGKWLSNYYSNENEDAVLMEKYLLDDI